MMNPTKMTTTGEVVNAIARRGEFGWHFQHSCNYCFTKRARNKPRCVLFKLLLCNIR
jgi:hypothetical protein